MLITGDLACEGVNLHEQCHELIHYDIPWSLIRIEQRNGRIDRYGQRHPPQITTLLLNPETEAFSGDLRVLSRLIEKEHEAHTALGDAASLMGKYDVGAEEDEIRKVLAGKASLDDVVKETQSVKAEDSIAGMLARIMAGAAAALVASPASADDATAQSSLYPSQVAFLEDALDEAYKTPAAPVAAGGVGWRDYGPQQIVELVPPPDLRQRLEVLPQSYLAERKVIERFKLVTSKARGKALLADALTDESDSSWPEAHYLGPLHPVIDWAADRAMASLGRNQVFAARGDVDHPTILLLGTLTNRRGQVVASSYLTAEFPNPGNPAFCMVTPHESATAMAAAVGYADDGEQPRRGGGDRRAAAPDRPRGAVGGRRDGRRLRRGPGRDHRPGRGVVAPGHGLDRRGRRAHPALRAAPAPRQRPRGAGDRGADGARTAAHPATAHRGAARPPGRRVRGGIGHGRERRPDRRRGLDQRALLHHRREVRVVPGEGGRAAQGVGRGRQERRRDRPLAVHRRPQPPGNVDRRPARRPAGHR